MAPMAPMVTPPYFFAPLADAAATHSLLPPSTYTTPPHALMNTLPWAYGAPAGPGAMTTTYY
jgi:hypothetical protein